MKKILFLGAGPLTLPALKYALDRGHEVLSTDNIPDNPGHRLAHHSFNVSTTDTKAAMQLAKARSVDAVIGYASEVSSLTAAAVAEQLNLPGPGLQGAKRLSLKDQFRKWTANEKLQPIAFQAFAADEGRRAALWAANLDRLVAVKPVDNSGSRGVSLAVGKGVFLPAFDRAAAASRIGRVLVEEMIPRQGPQICGDGFVEDGKLVFAEFGDNDSGPGEGDAGIFLEQYPSSHPPDTLARVRDHLAVIIEKSGFQRGPVNFDAVVQPDGRPHVIEIGIRSGGNLMPDALSLLSGIDLVAAAVDCAADPGFKFPAQPAGVPGRSLLTYVAHSERAGRFKKLHIAGEIRDRLVRMSEHRRPGDPVLPFNSAAGTVAVLLLSFPTREEMLAISGRLKDLCVVELEPEK